MKQDPSHKIPDRPELEARILRLSKILPNFHRRKWAFCCRELLIKCDARRLSAITLGVEYDPGVMMLAGIGLLAHVEPSNAPG